MLYAQRSRRIRTYAHVLACLLIICQVQATWANEVYALLYPQIDEPTRSIFDEARRTIRQRVAEQRNQLVERSLPPNSDSRAAAQVWLAASKPGVVLALGRTALDAVSGLEKTYSIVVGLADIAMQEQPDVSAVTLLPEPRDFFTTIQTLSPRTQRIFVVFDPARHSWLIEIATRQALELSLTLMPLSTTDIRGASVHFTNIFRYSNPSTDFLWIIDSQFVTDDATLPMLVKESWLSRFPVCSTAAQHLTRGVLCTTYAPPASVGDWMMRLGEERLLGHPPRIVMPKKISRGVNVRVSSHLGLSVGPSQRRFFELIVGE